ncbi:lysozyme [Nodosilinea sp. LEGE 06152]|uniref:glycoside hydrolase family protein n=1 Tax=Nodosilinea sp. LEGE 06152 TaxID=2777966 RepID=UPI001880AD27|nr:lysozyme [Nodosilinea sp. LEGE 06152]
MGTWIKETDIAIYLMQGGYWISRITKYPSSNNPKEQVVNIGSVKSWFSRSDYPRAMTVSIGTGAPEPQPMPPPPPPPPPPTGTINAAGLEIVKGFEGLGLAAYPDPGTGGEPWTIGYGHTSAAGPPQVYKGLTITRAEAEEILKRDLAKYEKAVASAVTRTPTSDQFSAMVSFTFNVGPGNFQTSTLLKKHNAGDFAGASEEFGRWVYAGGNVMPGLQRRRRAERALYRSENWQQFM